MSALASSCLHVSGPLYPHSVFMLAPPQTTLIPTSSSSGASTSHLTVNLVLLPAPHEASHTPQAVTPQFVETPGNIPEPRSAECTPVQRAGG